MREDISRILKLVQEGKLNPEDAAELIDAMQGGEDGPAQEKQHAQAASEGGAPPPPPPPPKAPSDGPFAGFIDIVEKVGKDVSTGINWTEVGDQLRKGAEKGVEAVKKAAQDIKDGKVSFGLFEAETRRIEQPLAVPAGKLLRVESVAGDIKVTCGHPGEGRLVATAIFKGDDRDRLREKAEAFALVVEESEHFVLIRQPDQSGLTVEFEVFLPEGVAVEAKNESGDVSLTGIVGACRVAGTSGDIHVSNASGSLNLDTANGNVQVLDSTLSLLNIENKNGDVALTGVTAATSIRSSSGDVKMVRCSAPSLAIDGVSGDIRVDLSEPLNGAANIRTVNGLISVDIPGTSNCRVNLSTLRGEVNCTIPLEDFAKDNRRTTGRIGDATGTLDVSAVNGDIFVRLREAAAV